MSSVRCRFRFHGNLTDLVTSPAASDWIDYELTGRVAVKHAIEALGAPHVEVEQIVADGAAVSFSHILSQNEEIDVYPQGFDVPAPNHVRLRQPLERPVKFVLDTHLGRLAAYLRMLGFDAVYENDLDDAALAEISESQRRVLLTRDRGLLKRSVVEYGYCVRHTQPRTQFVEVSERYALQKDAAPWSRCVICNGLLEAVAKADVIDQLEPKTKLYYEDFQQCTACGQVYWRGSHFDRMEKLVNGVLDQTRQDG